MTDKQAVIRLVKLITKYKLTISLIMGGLIVSTILNFAIPLVSRKIMDDGFIAGNKNLIIFFALASFLIFTMITVLDLFTEKLRIGLSAKIQYKLNEEAFNHLLHIKIGYYDKQNYAETFSSLNMDISAITSIADEGMFFVVTQIFSIIGGIIGLFILDYRMTAIVLVIIPIKYIVMKFFAKKRKEKMDQFIEANKDYAGWFGDTIGGVREVRLLGIICQKQGEFSVKQKKVIGKLKGLNMLSQWNMGIDSIMMQAMILVIYIVGANLVFDLGLTIGTVFAFITYSAYVTGPISAILNIKYLLSGIIPSTKRYYDFLSEPEESGADGKELPVWDEVIFDKVTFSYDEKIPAVEDINLCILKGHKIAFVGKNGCGKSTLIELLLRLRKPQVGNIRVGDINIEEISLIKYRELFSVVSQDVYLFNDTIRNNIRLYKDIDDETINKACEDSGLVDFIKEVSLDYNVGANGAMLSGGQKQKVALARAIVLDRPIFILDEATSNADVSSELQINSLLRTRLKEKTVIVISHRESVLKEMDQIILIDTGKIVWNSGYEELIESDLYKQIQREL
ncbi:ATP-binding cassette, subfamily B, MsbA [Butyrivibrio fibrisolvens DSM 3071]|uniref:ATP-binding cassette, subfamily B, MsbA n=1 Tax=Butyrivibrio fibrisolvens DSM 3071 TaxID=1121131 RepID=A0A1M5Q6H1_BUTFI|nr:ABC transporter ATP-binding protein [Butyrivibrio fibrisolvens]SHH09359.1 ATP-binding cassette, subfamily B, MsbA [Butyrivibrio fibrisolvens DSM 3071]